MYQKQFSFKGVLYTRCVPCIRFAQSLNIETVDQFPENARGHPFLFNMIARVKRRFKSRFYGYMDMRTLLNPAIFNVLESIEQDTAGYLSGHPFEIATSSFVLPINDLSDQMESLKSCRGVFSSISDLHSRTPFSVPISVVNKE